MPSRSAIAARYRAGRATAAAGSRVIISSIQRDVTAA